MAMALRGRFEEVASSSEDFTDPRYYPPRGDEAERVLRYFFFMVAIDHRTSRFRPFEGRVGGELYHGADLLYRLGALKYSEDPEFFSPEIMARISEGEVAEWLRTESGETIWDPGVRAELLRDAGMKLLKFFGGSVSKLIEAAESYIRHPTGHGLGSLFKVFKAYSDPVEKKLFLFVKFVRRRGLIRLADPENLEVPVDNHLTRVALRLGLVEPSGWLMRKILSGARFTDAEDVELRIAVRRAYKYAARVSGIEPDRLDDFLWIFGRRYCTREGPVCERAGSCPLSSVCPSYGRASGITEHYYVDTFYY